MISISKIAHKIKLLPDQYQKKLSLFIKKNPNHANIKKLLSMLTQKNCPHQYRASLKLYKEIEKEYACATK